MITVITNEGHQQPVENPYKGMSLAEACDKMVLDIHETVNEFMQDILLTEHAYLLENGSEITYVNEEGEDTKNGEKLKDRVRKMFESAGEIIRGLWTRFIDWIADKAENIKAFLLKWSINKATYKKAVDKLKADNVKGLICHTGPYIWVSDEIQNIAVDPKFGFLDNIDKYSKDDIMAPGQFYDMFEYKHLKKNDTDVKPVSIDMIEKAGQFVFEYDRVINQIKKARRDCDTILKAMQKQAEHNDQEDRISKAGEMLKSNANVCKDKIKLYSKLLVDYTTVVKEVVKTYRHDNMDDLKNEAKEKANNVKSGAKKLGSNIAGAFKKKEEKVEGEVVESASLYDGKYFRV